MNSTPTFSCQIRAQGGRLTLALAVGRKGKKQILVSYRIQSGEHRERFLPAGRVFDLTPEQIAQLPNYVRRTCPARTFRPERTANTPEKWTYGCELCGHKHRAILHGVERTRTYGQNDYYTYVDYDYDRVLGVHAFSFDEKQEVTS